MFSEKVKKEITEQTLEFKAKNKFYHQVLQGKIELIYIAQYLVSLRFLIQSYQKLFQEAAIVSEHLQREDLSRFYKERRGEESGHDEWATSDLNYFIPEGFDKEALRPCHSAQQLIYYLRTLIQKDPAYFLAHLVATECFTILFGEEWLKALEDHCGVDRSKLTVIDRHVELDKDHTDENFKLVERLLTPEQKNEEFIRVIQNVFVFFNSIFNESMVSINQNEYEAVL